jgi:hypothetical protein
MSSEFKSFTYPNCGALYQIIKVEAGRRLAEVLRRRKRGWKSIVIEGGLGPPEKM